MNTVLVIDDDPDIAELVRLNLKSEGYAVEHASNGEEGLELARSIQPGLIILDVLMPRKDGLSTFEDILADEVLRSIPVIMLTSVNAKLGFNLTVDDLETQYGKAPEAFVEKPISRSELLYSVHRYLPQ